MIFLFHAAFALELIALIASVSLFIWALRHEGPGIPLGRGVGFIVTLLAILGMLSTGQYGGKYWEEGYDYDRDVMKGYLWMQLNQTEIPKQKIHYNKKNNQQR